MTASPRLCVVGDLREDLTRASLMFSDMEASPWLRLWGFSDLTTSPKQGLQRFSDMTPPSLGLWGFSCRHDNFTQAGIVGVLIHKRITQTGLVGLVIHNSITQFGVGVRVSDMTPSLRLGL